MPFDGCLNQIEARNVLHEKMPLSCYFLLMPPNRIHAATCSSYLHLRAVKFNLPPRLSSDRLAK
jgi:hypothetical protein